MVLAEVIGLGDGYFVGRFIVGPDVGAIAEDLLTGTGNGNAIAGAFH